MDRVRTEENYARDLTTKPTRAETDQSQDKQTDKWESGESRVEADKQEASRDQVDKEPAEQGVTGRWGR